jgi:hypothetical protein
MTIPLVLIFFVLLGAYLISSAWSGLDSRYPIAAALSLLVGAAVADAVGNPALAGTFAGYALILFGGGSLLLMVDQFRDAHRFSLSSNVPELIGPPGNQ